MNMNRMLETAVQQWPEILFLVREGITYSEFMEQVKARATTLMEHGVVAGDNVGVLAHNIPEFIITMFAAWYCGARVLLLDTNLTNTEYDNMTALVQCKLVVAEKSFFMMPKVFNFLIFKRWTATQMRI